VISSEPKSAAGIALPPLFARIRIRLPQGEGKSRIDTRALTAPLGGFAAGTNGARVSDRKTSAHSDRDSASASLQRQGPPFGPFRRPETSMNVA
jgi:hypothetical protein